MDKPELWIEKDFLTDSDSLFRWLLENIEWDERMWARKTVSFGVPYNYSGMTYPEVSFPEPLQIVLEKLHQRLGYESNNCLVNYYPDGTSTMGFHYDSFEGLSPDSGIAIVSLGADRTLTFQNRTEKSVQFSYSLPCGSLLFMTALTQDHWKHGVLAQDNVGARISLTFRSILTLNA